MKILFGKDERARVIVSVETIYSMTSYMWPQYRFGKLECFQNWEKALVSLEVDLALWWRC